jgi:hypothetical protein
VTEAIKIGFAEAEASFFQDPSVEPTLPGMLGVLYLLRRDLKQCMTPPTEAYLPAVMLVMAGIDLLAKFYAGSDKAGSSGRRFKKFVADFMWPRSRAEIESIYQLRNALMHSFGLYSKHLKKSEIVQEWKFSLQTGASQSGKMVISLGDGKYVVSARTLFQHFEAAVIQYRTRLAKDPKLQRMFSAMFEDYGTTGVGSASHPMTVRQREEQIRQS